jgi:hypothetical protein
MDLVLPNGVDSIELSLAVILPDDNNNKDDNDGLIGDDGLLLFCSPTIDLRQLCGGQKTTNQPAAGADERVSMQLPKQDHSRGCIGLPLIPPARDDMML